MTLNYIDIPLFSDTYYTYAIPLEGVSYNLEFVYNERAQLYYINLYDADMNALVLGEALVPNYPIFQDYQLPPLTGSFWMEEKANIVSEPYKKFPDSIDQYYTLFYIYIT